MAHDHLVFITWKTWGNAIAIDTHIAAGLLKTLPSLAIAEHAALLEIAIVPSHVHVVAELGARATLPRLVQRLKGATSRFANRDGWSDRILRWEAGYDSRTVGRRNLAQIARYLDNQGSRHGIPLLGRWSGASRALQSQEVLFRAVHPRRDAAPAPLEPQA